MAQKHLHAAGAASLLLLAVALAVVALGLSPTVGAPSADVSAPEVALAGVPFDVSVAPADSERPYRLDLGGQSHEGQLSSGQEKITGLRLGDTGLATLHVTIAGHASAHEIRLIPAWLSVVPALLAIVLALAFRAVLPALVGGVALGALFFAGFSPVPAVGHLAATIVGAMTSRGNASILLFSLLLGGMIGLIGQSGAALRFSGLVTRRATTRRRGQVATWALGLLIFFDDYANALLVGSAMRPVSDRLRISREKLAFLVDATAAPVSSLALVSSWIGVEVGYINDQLRALDLPGDAYLVFLETLPYRFYPWLMLFFGLLVATRGRDFGPMYRAERRAFQEGKLVADGARPASDFDASGHPPVAAGQGRARNAIVPIVVLLAVAIAGLVLTGAAGAQAEGLPLTARTVFGNASSTRSLLAAAAAGALVAFVMAVSSRALSLRGAGAAFLAGMRAMALACAILVLAWSIGRVCRELHTASYLIGLLGDTLSPELLPALVFLLAAAVSFATGTSWGTMAILFPLVVPLAHALGPGDHPLLLGAISSILAGSVFGDHCSPISDTTILSSLAASSDHMDHVRTQLPYALTVGVVSVVAGDLLTAYTGLSPLFGLAVGAVALAAVVQVIGRDPETAHAS